MQNNLANIVLETKIGEKNYYYYCACATTLIQIE